MKKGEHKELKWLINFAQTNIDEISPEERGKLLRESEEFLFPGKELREMEEKIPYPVVPHDPSDESRKEIMKRILDKAGVLSWIEQLPDKVSDRDWPLIIAWQRSLKRLIRMWVMEDIFHWEWTGRVVVFINRDYGSHRLTSFPLATSHWEFLQFKFFKLLEGLPSKVIRQCQECKKYFLDPTRYRKKYCSPQCLWRYGQREYRKAHPEEYKAMMRTIMKKRYDKEKKQHPRKYEGQKRVR